MCSSDLSLDATARGRPRIRARGTDYLVFGEHEVDLRAVEQLADASHVTGVGLAMALLVRRGFLDGRRTLAEALDLLDEELAGPEGVAALLSVSDEDFAVPRRYEVAAAVNRLRGLRVLR